MKKFIYLVVSLVALSACTFNKNTTHSKSDSSKEKFGVFLGASDANVEKISKYQKVMIDIDEFSEQSIKYLKDNNVEIYAYLSVGSLEKYRPYYEEFKDYTFMDYENWPDERWIDVSEPKWISHLNSEATRFQNLGAKGLFMDNFDVYYIVMEEYECANSFKQKIYNACQTILRNFDDLGLELVINSGTDLLERLKDESSPSWEKIDVYCQECVFSKIEDYERDIFSKQDEETQSYYLSITSFMKECADILFLEYTIDEELIKEVDQYCKKNNFYYYVSSTIELK